MATYLSAHAIEQGTYAITVAFTDDTGDAVIPNAGTTWKLTDVSGNVINSRSAVDITEAASVVIVLSGADLAIGTNGKERVLYVSGTYNSDLGNNLPLKQEVRFYIDDLVNV
jgi:hypothetical protein